MLRSASSVLVTPDAGDEHEHVGRCHELDRVVGGEQGRGVEQDHVEATACGRDDLSLGGDDLRRVRPGIRKDVGDDLDPGDARLMDATRLVVHCRSSGGWSGGGSRS